MARQEHVRVRTSRIKPINRRSPDIRGRRSVRLLGFHQVLSFDFRHWKGFGSVLKHTLNFAEMASRGDLDSSCPFLVEDIFDGWLAMPSTGDFLAERCSTKDGFEAAHLDTPKPNTAKLARPALQNDQMDRSYACR
jgi:hypothetical protein